MKFDRDQRDFYKDSQDKKSYPANLCILNIGVGLTEMRFLCKNRDRIFTNDLAKKGRLNVPTVHLPIPMPRTISFMRHGESTSNVLIGEIYDAFAKSEVAGLRAIEQYRSRPEVALDEWGLTQKGRAQVRSAARAIKQMCLPEPDLVLVSPHMRTRQSADLFLPIVGWDKISRSHPNELVERRWGLFDGEIGYSLNRLDFKMEQLLREQNPLMWKPLGGESFFDVAYGRLAFLLQRIASSPYTDVFCITHAELMLSAICLFQGLDAKQFKLVYDQRVGNCEVISFSRPQFGSEIVPQTIYTNA